MKTKEQFINECANYVLKGYNYLIIGSYDTYFKEFRLYDFNLKVLSFQTVESIYNIYIKDDTTCVTDYIFK